MPASTYGGRRRRHTRRGRGLGSILGGLADHVFGLGRRKRRTRRRRATRGRGIWDLIKKGVSGAHDYIKKNRVISSNAPALLKKVFGDKSNMPGHIGNFIRNVGYGRRRRTRRRSGGCSRRSRMGRGHVII